MTYASLVGRILAQQRELQGKKQGEFATLMGLSQPAYSRIESGDSVLTVSQLRLAAAQLKLPPSEIIGLADRYEAQLRQHGVLIVTEKQDHSAAVVLGLGLLAAVLMGGK